jgi:hypothetical protein
MDIASHCVVTDKEFGRLRQVASANALERTALFAPLFPFLFRVNLPFQLLELCV